MAICLGIDTGGTYTDAALVDLDHVDPQRAVVAKAKALTTRHDLAIGIGEAARNAVEQASVDAAEIALVSLSTTLATNALVEGQGGRIALIAIGFAPRDLEKAGLADALGDDPVIHLPGGHTTHGAEAAPLDLATLEAALPELTGRVTGFAVAGYFAVRNPDHEQRVADFLRERTGLAVTSSHELSAQLNGPKRALTTVLNARLVPMISRLIEATRTSLSVMQIDAPLMVVRGDGALVSADFATKRPIETILSGPAASLVGAHYLTGCKDALVNDIGGTTSDVALLQGGRPRIDPAGAMVGGYRTMIEAVAMHTFGLGGDSQVTLATNGLNTSLTLGPRRCIPLSLLAQQHGEAVHSALDRQSKSYLNGRFDGQFALLSGTGLAEGLSASERKLLSRIGDAPQPLDGVVEGQAHLAALNRLVATGLVMISSITPSDALHGIDLLDHWDGEAARKGLSLLARQRTGSGNAVAESGEAIARMIVRTVERRSAEVVLETAFDIDGRSAKALVTHELVRAHLEARQQAEPESTIARFDVGVSAPLIGLGASARRYHPPVGTLIGTEVIVPEHADVANAIGAVVGQVSLKVEVVVTQPSEGRFAVSGIERPFESEQEALQAADANAAEQARSRAREAGAQQVSVSVHRDIKRAPFEGRDMLVEAVIKARATGRPPLAG